MFVSESSEVTAGQEGKIHTFKTIENRRDNGSPLRAVFVDRSSETRRTYYNFIIILTHVKPASVSLDCFKIILFSLKKITV